MKIEIGQRYGKLTVIKDLGMIERPNGKKRHYWKCKCDCGNTFNVRGDCLKSGNNKSCGCLQFEHAKITHNMTNTKIYRVWASMKQRCENPNDNGFKWYGDKGIKVCKEWSNSFESFYSWAKQNGYKEGLTIERINVDGDYEPKNCKWITQQKQLLNTTRNKFITYKGKTQTLKEWSDELGIKYMTLWYRLKRWSVERAFEESVTTIPRGSTSSIDTKVEAVNSLNTDDIV